MISVHVRVSYTGLKVVPVRGFWPWCITRQITRVEKETNNEGGETNELYSDKVHLSARIHRTHVHKSYKNYNYIHAKKSEYELQ